MIVGSLFSGAGGIDRGLELAGHEIAWACESDRYCRSVIERHWPGLEIYPDVREIDAGTPRVELLAGGFPCTDLSQAGQRAGITGERSGLWFAFRDAIRLLRPGHVLIENVPGLATARGSRPGESALGTVIADLAEAGYVGSYFRLRAADVGAPHRRERIFIVAVSGDTSTADPERLRVNAGRGLHGRGARESGRPSQEALPARPQMARAADALADRAGATTDPRGERLARGRGSDESSEAGKWNGRTGPTGSSAPTPDSGGLLDRRAQPNERTQAGVETPRRTDPNRRSLARTGTHDRHEREATPDSDHAGRAQQRRPVWGIYEPAISRWEQILDRRAPEPTDERGRLTPALVEWMLGFPDQWTAGSSRTQRLKMLGNACQVQVAELIGSMILDREA